MKLRSLADLQEPEDVVRRFTSLGFSTGGMLSAEEAAEYQQRVVGTVELVEDVPDGVRDAFDRLRTLHSYGVLCYDTFTAVVDLAPRVAELAVRQRFVLFQGGTVDAVDGAGTLFVIAFATVNELLEQLRSHHARIAGWPKSPRFAGGFSQMLAWARREGLLSGQRARHAERRLNHWRNLMAHPDGHHLLMPVDSAREIHDLAEFINRLWGARTPGGRLYPAAVQREVIALAFDEHGDSSVGPAESLPLYQSLKDATILIVRGDRDDEALFDYDSAFENTRVPAELLWGPGPFDQAVAWLSLHEPSVDEIEYLDRYFLLRERNGALDPPRTPDVAAGLGAVDRRGNWYAVRADFPSDATVHVKSRHQPYDGECEDCAAEGIAEGTWTNVLDALKQRGEVVRPMTPRSARMPGRWHV